MHIFPYLGVQLTNCWPLYKLLTKQINFPYPLSQLTFPFFFFLTPIPLLPKSVEIGFFKINLRCATNMFNFVILNVQSNHRLILSHFVYNTSEVFIMWNQDLEHLDNYV